MHCEEEDREAEARCTGSQQERKQVRLPGSHSSLEPLNLNHLCCEQVGLMAEVVAAPGPGAPVNVAGIPETGVQEARLGGERAIAAINFPHHDVVDEPAAQRKEHAEGD